ncbi:membrane lipoprotein lipid attachment site-containing protein [Pontibacillus marinus]|uniref:Uncharacterized protein n=1 Tax=Pontibacillus marinus BH030004 = DSM 16465 TaxID=1385511 RepID=A0A0A5GBW3_9BACI|nr:membrane lipoprotein lipid attachment site-containing protein [Pontibacillus marinus]KGX89489.1 hypothetical protein N783_06185 [Pontibacillus marinus BH030004 = DSM 16465]
MKKITRNLFLVFMFVLSGCNTAKGHSPSLEEAISIYSDGEETLLYQNDKNQTAVFQYENNIVMCFYEVKNGTYKFEEGNGDTAFYINRADSFNYHYFTHPESNQLYFYGIVQKPKNAAKITLTYTYDYENKQVSEKREADINEHNIFVIPLNRELTEVKDISYKIYDTNGEMIKEIGRR